MPQTYQRNAGRFLSILITVGMLVASLQLFFRTRIERLQNQKTEKLLVRREADSRHALALERLQNQLQAYDQFATSFTAFVRSSVNVRIDEFRNYLNQSGAFTQDPALRSIVLVGAVDSTQYIAAAKGFALRADLNQLTALPNGAVFADTDETSLLVRSIVLPEDLIPRLERSRGKNLRLVMLVDIEALLSVFAEPVPGLMQLNIRMGSVEQPDRDQWSSQQFQFAKGGRSVIGTFEHDLSVSGLTWEMEWTEQLEKKTANANNPAPLELTGLGLSIAALLILLRLCWVPRRSNATTTQIQQAILQTPVPAFRVDTHGFVTDMNQQALTHIRKNREEIVGLVRLRDLSSGPFVPVTGVALGLQPGEMIAFGPLHQYEQQQAPPAMAAAAGLLVPAAPRHPVASAPREFALDHEATQVSQPRGRAATDSTEVSPVTARREVLLEEKPKAARMQENPFRRTVIPEPYNVTDGFDLAVFQNLTGSDIEVMEEARKLSLQSLPQQFQALCEIVTAGDARRIQIAAHTMKSNLALLGSKGAMEICLKIEQDQLEDVPIMIWLDRLEPLLVKILKELKEADFGGGKKPASDNPFKRREA